MSYHIQDVLKSGQDTAPAPRTTTDDIIATAGRIRTRRTWGTAAGGTLAVLAVAGAATVGLTADDGNAPSAGQGAAAAPAAVTPISFTSGLGGAKAGPYTLGAPGEVTAGYQELPVYTDSETWQDDNGKKYPLEAGTITVYKPGIYDPATFGTVGGTFTPAPAGTVTVNGAPGVSRVLEVTFPSSDRKYERTALAWQYGTDAWATFLPDSAHSDLPEADALRIAGALTVGDEEKLRVPYDLGYLPEGWQPVAVTERPAASSNLVSEVFLRQGLPDDLGTQVDEVMTKSIKIIAMRGEPKDAELRGKDGVHCYPQQSCMIIKGDWLLEVTDLDAAVSMPELGKIANSLQVVDLADRDSWLPADELNP